MLIGKNERNENKKSKELKINSRSSCAVYQYRSQMSQSITTHSIQIEIARAKR